MADLQTGDEAMAAARNAVARWLRVSYRAGAVVDALATVSMIFPRRLWSLRFKDHLTGLVPNYVTACAPVRR
jgi:hypothetical protein